MPVWLVSPMATVNAAPLINVIVELRHLRRRRRHRCRRHRHRHHTRITFWSISPFEGRLSYGIMRSSSMRILSEERPFGTTRSFTQKPSGVAVAFTQKQTVNHWKVRMPGFTWRWEICFNTNKNNDWQPFPIHLSTFIHAHYEKNKPARHRWSRPIVSSSISYFETGKRSELTLLRLQP